MEYLEGETLRTASSAVRCRWTRGAADADEIAGARTRADRLGIVHRDLKPANVHADRGRPKLLDFGLAKVFAAPAGSDPITSLPTQANVTEAGTILGTFQYMAPEQLEGQEADARTDIFALGEVLYEMTTGARAFEGSTRASLVSAILRDEPRSVSQLQPMAPAPLDRLVRKCLAKDPEDRWQSARDVGSELEWVRGSGSGTATSTTPRPKHGRAGWVAAAVLASAVAALLLLRARTPNPSSPGAIRFEVPPPKTGRVVVASVTASFFALSPDGRRIAFCDVSVRHRFLQRRPDLRSGLRRGGSPGHSRNGGRVLAILVARRRVARVLRRRKAEESPALRRTPEHNLRRGARRHGDVGPRRRDRFLRVELRQDRPEPGSRNGGQAVAGDAPRRRAERTMALVARFPSRRPALPLHERGGRGMASVGARGPGGARWVPSTSARWRRWSPRSHTQIPAFSSSAREGALLAQRFDPNSLKTEGEPVAISPEVQSYAPTGAADLSASSGAPMIAFSEGASRARLVWVDRAGKDGAPFAVRIHDSSPRLSPDRKRLAFALVDRRLGTTDVWVQDLERGTASRVNFGPASESFPAWAPDGRRIFFSSDKGGMPPELFEEDLASMKSDALPSSPGVKFVSDVSPDGRLLAYTRYNGGESTVEMMSLTGEKKSVALLPAGSDSDSARFSPDGRFVAYDSGESGRAEVYVRPLSGSGERWQISRDGGQTPLWSLDGRSCITSRRTRSWPCPCASSPDSSLVCPKRSFRPTSRSASEARAPST